LPAFNAPEKAGIYRMRFVQDWCSIDPMGDADGKFDDFKQNGGVIVDVLLQVGNPGTGINNVKAVNGENTIYDLTGRRIEKIVAPGIYIVNGKKVVVK
jgi:hypothetical protein